ncbi:agamous-like MADS-box protein AGL80 [Beta vulgaris subsp. vulgaris]|uniref:agamous-like MADS-box protein AGL80 n=1 Tax=Beta vulgaris subsp. vulgaris TaxID=3555 RepID=UPI00053FCE25|nr:agamous-like MADS-box protein AGL80 [Beta vulgaris subsp. vulgaris]
MEFISKEKARNTTYEKRKKGLIKKGKELSILCNVPVCIIMYPYKQGKQSLEAEVYAFKGEVPPSKNHDHAKLAREIIDRYLRVPKEERYKRALNLYDMFDEWKKRADQELCKLRYKNALAKYPSWDSKFEGLNLDQLMELLAILDQKIEFVSQRIDMIKGTNHNHNHSQNNGGLVPYFEPATMPNLMISSENSNVDYTNVEEFNQFPMLNYSINNNNNHHYHQEYYHQVMPFNPTAISEQIGGTRMDDHGGSTSSSNMIMYNMNMMGGVSPMYYDQGSGFGENVDGSSSYGAGLAMSSMPLQLPMMPNVTLPRQMQYHQMFYK